MTEAHTKLLRHVIDCDGKLDPGSYKRVFGSGMDESFFHTYDPKLNQFNDTIESLVFDYAKDYFDEFGVCPSDDGLISEVRKNGGLSPADKRSVTEIVATIRQYDAKVADVPLLMQEVMSAYRDNQTTYGIQKFLERKVELGIEASSKHLISHLAKLTAKTSTNTSADGALFAHQFVSKYIAPLRDNPEPVKPSARWGFSKLDRSTGGMFPGTLTLLGAGLSVGKSWLLQEVTLFNAIDLGANCVLANKEMLPEQIRFRMMCRQTGIPYNKLVAGFKYLTEEEQHIWEVAEQGLTALGDRLLFLDSTRCQNISQIKNEITQHFGNRQVHLTTIDYLDKLDPSKGRYTSDHERVAMVSKEFKDFALEYKTAGYSATQNNRKGNKNPNADIGELSFLQPAKDADTLVMISEDPENTYVPPEGDNPGIPGVLFAKVVRGRSHGKGAMHRLIVDFATGSIGEASEFDRTDIGRARRERAQHER